MDRQPDDLDRHFTDKFSDKGVEECPAFPLPNKEEHLVTGFHSSGKAHHIPERLLGLKELDVHYDSHHRALWTFMRPAFRPSFTPPMLADFEVWQEVISQNFGPEKIPLDFLILGSRAPGVFCFGGDLDLFHRLIRQRDLAGLVTYGHRCVAILYRNMHALNLPLLTVGMVQGQALGGGLEALLSFDIIVAERGASFGLPEVMFGLFPGMGAHVLLARKLGTAIADRIILSNQTYSAEEMYELGVVAHLAEPGDGIAATRELMTRSARRHGGLVAAKRAMRIVAPVEMSELKLIVELWAETALGLSETDLKLMSRLAAAQGRQRRIVA